MKRKSRVYDLVVSKGTYEDKGTGDLKKRWLTIGSIWIEPDGTPGTILLERTFNPAGVVVDPNHEESGRIFVAAFENEDA